MDWQRFRIGDMVVECRKFMRMGRLRESSIIWRRHCLDEAMLSSVADILADMPENIAPREFVPWLSKDVLPYIHDFECRYGLFNYHALYFNESRSAVIAAWIESRARTVEALTRSPHEALKVIKLLECFKNDTIDPLVYSPASPAQHVRNTMTYSARCLETLDGTQQDNSVELKSMLEDLVFLWDEHDFKISLEEYGRASSNSIGKNECFVKLMRRN